MGRPKKVKINEQAAAGTEGNLATSLVIPVDAGRLRVLTEEMAACIQLIEQIGARTQRLGREGLEITRDCEARAGKLRKLMGN